MNLHLLPPPRGGYKMTCVYLSVCLSVCLFVCLFVCLCVCLFVCLSVSNITQNLINWFQWKFYHILISPQGAIDQILVKIRKRFRILDNFEILTNITVKGVSLCVKEVIVKCSATYPQSSSMQNIWRKRMMHFFLCINLLFFSLNI